MEALFNETNRILQEIERGFQKLATHENLDVENDIHLKLTSAEQNCNRLSVLIYKEPVSQRQIAMMRTKQLNYDIRHLKSSLQLYRENKKGRQAQLSEREQLLSHRFTANNAAGSPETCLDMDYALQQHTQMGNAHQGVDEMIATGGNILGSLINQRETLQGAQLRIRTIGSTLGLSNHTMKLIERRFQEDKYVLLGGMVVTLIVIGLVIYYMVL